MEPFDFAKLLNKKRRKLNWSKMKMAQSLEVSYNIYLRWEKQDFCPPPRYIHYWEKKIDELK